ncbi:hypothetical protein C8Q78DRAFT_1088267 [Trametes maxima]|nr:hypothetical protein C8Q78DRAFT_1088267 [Trametes maxima]
MSAATVQEPFLLSSYPESAVHRKHSAAPVYASLPSSSDADPFVTVAVHGDGVHVLDTSMLHPAVSHTLGPSTSFSCSPATRITRRNGVRVCTTYAVLEAGSDVRPDAKGKTVVAWEEAVSGVTGSEDLPGEKNKRVAVAPHPVSHIYAPGYLPNTSILVGPGGQLSVADEELGVQHTSAPQNHQASTLLRHFLFPSVACTFLPPSSISSYNAISLSFLRSGEISRVSMVGVAQDGSLNILGECVIPIDETDIMDISCSNTGFISILLYSGAWHSFSLSTFSTSTLTVSAAAEPIRLQALTFTSPGRVAEGSLCALTSSHVLLAGITSGSPVEIVLLLWDLRYGVLLAQQTLPIPSTLPRARKTGAIVRLTTLPVPSPNTAAGKAATIQLNAVLVLAPSPERDSQADSSPARSTILVVPLSVPANSTIAAALGRANAGARWVSAKHVTGALPSQHPRGAPEMSAAARKTLNEMRASVNGSAGGSVAGAEAVFFEYAKQEQKGKRPAAPGTPQEGQPLEYAFVQSVLALVLPPTNEKTQSPATYSAKIVRYLLERRTLSSSMVEGGLLLALVARDDWESISLAMRTVTDLPEADVVHLLSKVVTVRRRSSAADDSAMQVDSVSAAPSVPALATFLVQCVVYPFTPASERVAFRKHLADATDIVPVLEVLDTWVVRHTENDALLSEGAAPSPSSPELPPLEKVLAFLQTLLDASFLALLAHPPAHRLLRTLAAHLEPALALTAALEHLRAPLEPFARAAAKAQQARADGAAAKEAGAKTDGGRDWRRKRKMAHEQAAVAVGLYQVEELVL